MKIFLTGSTGFLGKSIKEFLPQYQYFFHIRGSCLQQNLNNFSPDVIIHSAGEIYNELIMYQSNVVMTDVILDWISENDRKLIYFGSSSEYGKTTKPMSEDDVCVPVSLYALTKLIGTQRCQNLAIEKNRDITIIRPFSVYGPNEPEHRLIPTIYRNLTQNSPTSLIEGSHDFIHIKDFVRFVDIIINSDRKRGEIYNVGYGKSYTNKEIFDKMKSLLNISECEISYSNNRKKCDSEIWVCDNSKIINKFGFKFEFDLDKGLYDYSIYKTLKL